MANISVVINTLNEEKSLPRAITSVGSLADETVVVDMHSDDATADVAKKLGAKVFEHERTGYVEPARNFAISKANGKWVLILDADEEISSTLVKKLKEIASKPEADYYRLPRKNIIFGKWMRHTKWWPDYNIRFFKKGNVSWSEVIHSVPMTTGRGVDLPSDEQFAIVHHNYETIEDYFQRMNKYTTIKAKALIKKKYKFIWKDLIRKPLNEFLDRYFASEGYKDDLHGLVLSILQATSEFVVYLKVWQEEKFLEQAITPAEVKEEMNSSTSKIRWWIADLEIKSKDIIASLPARIVKKLLTIND